MLFVGHQSWQDKTRDGDVEIVKFFNINSLGNSFWIKYIFHHYIFFK